MLGIPRRKHSEGKATWPGRKQVYRTYEAGQMAGDVVTIEGDAQPGEPLIKLVMRGGKRVEPPKTLSEIREYAARNRAQLPDALRELERAAKYPVCISQSLQALAKSVDQRMQRTSDFPA